MSAKDVSILFSINPVTIEKKAGRDGNVYGYKCPQCCKDVLYARDLSENVVVFVCAFCEQFLYVSKVLDNGVERDPIPMIINCDDEEDEL